jgi:hypothetical protein
MPESKPKSAAPNPDRASDQDWDKLTPSERFIRTARELGCEENMDRFDAAVVKIGKAGVPAQEPKVGGKRGE